MEALFNQATRTAELLHVRSPEGRLEMLDTALDEGYATIWRNEARYELEWHGLSTSGWNELEAIDNWIALALREAGEAA